MNKKYKSALKPALPFLLLPPLLLSSPAMAAPTSDWRPTLVMPASGIFSPSAAIQITLPKNLSNKTLQHLALELDAIDVTSQVSLSGNTASVTPAQPLSWGKHHLRLLEYAEDGSIIERGDWTLEVRQSKRFRESTLQTNTNLKGVYRVAVDKSQTGLPSRLQGTGNTDIAGALANGNWRLSGSGGLLYYSQPSLTPGQRKDVELEPYLVTLTSGNLTAVAGRQTVAPDSLIMRGFPRRGVSVSLHSTDKTTSVTGFVVHTEDISGFQGGLGVGNPTNRVNGVVANYRPIDKDPNALLISATYLAGTGPEQIGTSSTGTTTVSSGHAGSVSVDGEMLQNRLRLRGEYATSKYNYDYYNPLSTSTSDYAYSALMQYTPWNNKLISGQPIALNFSLQRTRIGTFFRSIANPQGISDREALLGVTNLTWNGWDAQATLGYETDNVDNVALLPSTHTNQIGLSVNYNPPQVPGPNGQMPSMPWYGQPSYSMSYTDVNQVLDKSGLNSINTGDLQSTRNLTLSATFSYTQSYWTIQETLGRNADPMHIGAKTENQETQITSHLQVTDRLTLSPGYQYNLTTYKNDAGQDATDTTVNLDLNYTFSDRLSSGLTYALEHRYVRDGSSDSTSQDLTANLGWTLQTQSAAKPGISLGASGLVHKNNDRVDPTQTVNNYQVNLTLTVMFASG